MYRRRSGGSGGTLFWAIMLGVVAGIVFFINDQQAQETPPSGGASSSPTMITPDATPTLDLALLELPTSTPQVAPHVQLIIPRANVATVVIPAPLANTGSWDIRLLGRNAGHLEGTAWIERPGNIVLAGHVEQSDGQPGIFARVSELSFADEVILMVGDQRRVYAVQEVFTTTPTDLTVLYPTPNDQITLITCDSYDFLSNTYLERVVAIALRIA